MTNAQHVDWFTFIFPDFIGLALGLWAVNAAITGKLVTAGRGGGSSVWYRLQTVWSRVGFAVLGLAILAAVTIDLRRKFLAIS